MEWSEVGVVVQDKRLWIQSRVETLDQHRESLENKSDFIIINTLHLGIFNSNNHFSDHAYSAVIVSRSSKLSLGAFICSLSLASSANRLMLAMS